MEKYRIVWSSEAVDALATVTSERLRRRILQRVGLLNQGPGLHRPRQTAFYRYRGQACEILDVVDATFMASYEIRK